MAFWDFLKKKRKGGESRAKSRRESSFSASGGEKSREETDKNLPPADEVKTFFKEKNRVSEKAFRVLMSPVVTEKSTDASSRGVYTFKVAPGANKPEIKSAVQELYAVKVRRVNLVAVPSKHRFSRGKMGLYPGYKKALVFLEEGQKIEVI